MTSVLQNKLNLISVANFAWAKHGSGIILLNLSNSQFFSRGSKFWSKFVV